MFAVYPHGILILSRIAMYGGVWESLFPGIDTRVLGASPMFWLPGSREICLWMGAIDAAKKVAVKAIDKHGLNLMVYPVRTLTHSRQNQNKATLTHCFVTRHSRSSHFLDSEQFHILLHSQKQATQVRIAILLMIRISLLLRDSLFFLSLFFLFFYCALPLSASLSTHTPFLVFVCLSVRLPPS